MTFWDGTRWVPDARPPQAAAHRPGRVMGATAEALLIVTLAFGLIAGTALAGRGTAQPTGDCSVADGWVSGWGLPTGELLNFMVTDTAGTTGWVLGFTDTGEWRLPVSSPNGATTYEFASKTWGRNGSKYRVYAACSTGS